MENNTEQFEIGSKVTYTPNFGGKTEKGIVHSYFGMRNYVYVVYKCDNNWDNYRDYTPQLTSKGALRLGWDDE